MSCNFVGWTNDFIFFHFEMNKQEILTLLKFEVCTANHNCSTNERETDEIKEA